MLKDLLYNLLLTLLSAAIIKGANNGWRIINTPLDSSTTLTPKRMKNIRKQFLISLFALIACIIVFIKNYSPILNLIFGILSGFFIVLLWGAFDAIYFPHEKIVKSHPAENANKLNKEVD